MRSIIADVLSSVVSSTPAVTRPKRFVEFLSVVAEEEPESVLSRVESGLPPSQESALNQAPADTEEAVDSSLSLLPVPAVMASSEEERSRSLADRMIGGEPMTNEPGEGDNGSDTDARSGSLDVDSLPLDSSEHEEEEQEQQQGQEQEINMEEEGEDDEENEEWVGEEEESADNALLLLPAPIVVSAEQRTSMTTELIQILQCLNDPLVAVRGEYLARNCSLLHSEDNRHLTWHKVLGEGAFGRVTLVSHELGKYAVKELTEVSIWLPF